MHHGKWNHEKRETYETSMEPEAEMRRLGYKWIAEKSATKTECMGLIILQFADRIEAARRREHKLLRLCARWIYSHDIYGHMSKELITKCKEVLGDDGQFTEYEMQKPAPVGNSAAMREALGKIRAELWNNTVIAGKKKFALYEIADAALSAPPRNCDVGTADEQNYRHGLWCSKHDVNGDMEADCANNACSQCIFKWAYEANESEVQ